MKLFRRLIEHSHLRQGSVLLAGFVPLAYVTSTKLLYNWPGLSDVINYACTGLAIWWLKEDA